MWVKYLLCSGICNDRSKTCMPWFNKKKEQIVFSIDIATSIKHMQNITKVFELGLLYLHIKFQEDASVSSYILAMLEMSNPTEFLKHIFTLLTHILATALYIKLT